MIFPPGLPGPQGVAGAIGATGATGATGAQGVQGASGSQGATGAQGFQGLVGAIGLQGAVGLQGAIGAQGVQGASGSQGATGAQGSSGAAGQTIYAETTTETVVSTASGGGVYFDITGMTATISPATNTNKVMVTFTAPYKSSRSSSSIGFGLRILRGSTVVWESSDDATGPSLVYVQFGTAASCNVWGVVTVSFQDSPATTSATTYKLQAAHRTTASTHALTIVPVGTTVTAKGTMTLREVPA